MAARPTWSGHLRLSLVTCPVALYTGTSSSGDIRFNMLNPKTMNRIKMVTTDPETGPIERSETVKGYEIDKGRYIIVTQEEIDSVRLESTRAIDIERFVDADEIDRIYWEDPYYLVPDGDLGVEAYAVIREAMRETNKIALGRVVMHQRERLLGMEPRDKGIVAYRLRTHEDVRKPEDFFRDIKDVKVNPQMLEIAEKIISQLEGDFEPEKFNDRYEDALREMIKRKSEGETVNVSAAPQEAQVVDLMEALRKSLQRDTSRRPSDTRAKPAPASKSKSKSSTGESKSRKRA